MMGGQPMMGGGMIRPPNMMMGGQPMMGGQMGNIRPPSNMPTNLPQSNLNGGNQNQNNNQ